MKRLLLLSIVLLTFIGAKAQNPFAEYGYTPKIATLSKGQFNEFHDQDTIVQIGSVLYNTKSKQIVAFVETDTVYSEATLEADIVSRWISPDPLADHPNQVDQSPYQYAWNNPVYWTDPDGRCPWCVVWAVVEVGLAVYDAYETGATIIDPNASFGQKVAAAGGFALGAILPGGGYSKGAKETVKAVDNVIDAGKVVDKVNDAKKIGGETGQKLLTEKAGPVAKISPSEVANKTPTQIDKRAKELGLEGKGKDPKSGQGAYVDPQTGKQRVLSHPNATDKAGNSTPHGHVNNAQGQRIDANGNVVKNESKAAHLPIKKD